MNEQGSTVVVGRNVTEVNGVEVITRGPARGPHPRTKEQVLFAGVTHLLLADDTEIYSCDDCPFTAASTQSVVSHRNNGHNRSVPSHPLIGEKEARRALTVMAEERAVGRSGWPARAAKRLNDLKIRPGKSDAWTEGSVGTFFHAWRETYPVRPRKLAAAIRAGSGTTPDVALTKARIVALLTQVLNLVAELPDDTADPVLVAKAAKWDQAQSLFGSGS